MTEAFETVPGTEHRTFALRAESPADTHLLAYMLNPCMERVCVLPLNPPPDVFMKFTLREDTLSLEHVRWVIAQVTDLHVAAESLALAHEYTGQRRYGAQGEPLPASKMPLFTDGVTFALERFRSTVDEMEALLDPARKRKRELETTRRIFSEIVSAKFDGAR